jgi:hypothetical protein
VREFRRLAKEAAAEREHTPTEVEIEALVRKDQRLLDGELSAVSDVIAYGPDPEEQAIVEAVKGDRRAAYRDRRVTGPHSQDLNAPA